MATDLFGSFKEAQKQGWQHFAPLEVFTTVSAAQLVKHARIRAGHRVLDVACGTGVVAITAALLGAKVSALDLTPALLEVARHNAEVAGVEIDWREGDAEALPFASGEFDVVLSQFGHMFAPRPELVTAEMLRVLKPGGTIAFSTWPPELYVGRMFALVGRYAPPLPPGISPPPLWGDPKIVSERLGSAVKNVVFNRGTMFSPALSLHHFQAASEKTLGPVIKLVETLAANDPAKLAAFRRDFESVAAEYYDDNLVRHDYLMTRAEKV